MIGDVTWRLLFRVCDRRGCAQRTRLAAAVAQQRATSSVDTMLAQVSQYLLGHQHAFVRLGKQLLHPVHAVGLEHPIVHPDGFWLPTRPRQRRELHRFMDVAVSTP